MSNRKITLYSKPNCVQCTASYRKLDEFGLEYEVKNAPDTLDEILALDKDYRQAPVMSVEIDGVVTDHWTGYRPDKIEALAEKAVAA